MNRWSRWRSDLARPEVPTARNEWLFLTITAAVIIAIAQISDPGSALDLLMLAPAFLAFALRAVLPKVPAEVFALLVIAPVTLVIGISGTLEGSLFLVVMMVLYTSWHLGSLTRAVVILVISTAVPWLLATLAPSAEIGWTAWTLAVVFTFAMGRVLRRQQALIEQLDQAREALADQAVAEERRRIARELHDLTGHMLAAVLLHVTGARHVLRRDLDEAERALIDAETVGRSSLDQIRATVAALRTFERGTDPAPPGSADVTELIGEYRRAGLVIDTTIDPRAAALQGPVGAAVHRIAREALANVARHAPENSIEFVLEVNEPDIHLVVVDRGRPGAQPDPNVEHFGLVGMRERARALGGQLEARPTPDGWRVEARLPAETTSNEDLVAT